MMKLLINARAGFMLLGCQWFQYKSIPPFFQRMNFLLTAKWGVLLSNMPANPLHKVGLRGSYGTNHNECSCIKPDCSPISRCSSVRQTVNDQLKLHVMTTKPISVGFNNYETKHCYEKYDLARCLLFTLCTQALRSFFGIGAVSTLFLVSLVWTQMLSWQPLFTRTLLAPRGGDCKFSFVCDAVGRSKIPCA